MNLDDTTPPTDTSKTQSDTLDPGPFSTEPTQPERCLYIKLPLLSDVPQDITEDPDQIEGLCALLKTAAQDFLQTYDQGKGELLFDGSGVQVVYDDGTSTTFCGFGPAAVSGEIVT